MAALAAADRVAESILHLITGNGADELVAAHAVVTVKPPQGDLDVVVCKRAAPRERVLVIRVDERPIDIHDCAKPAGRMCVAALCHYPSVPRGERGQTPARSHIRA